MAAQYGTAVFMFAQGFTLEKDIYFDDTAGNNVRWDNTGTGAGAATSDHFIMPANGSLIEVALAAATGQTKTSIMRNGAPTGQVLRNSLHLVTVAIKRPMNIPFNAGEKVEMSQLA